MSGVNDYQVLNVRVKYSGGVAAYLNGNLVARLNLAENFDSNTESLAVHDPSVFSKFHVILSTAGIQEGTNVFSFEIHRPVGGTSSDAVVFDATGVFGVDDCSTVVDSFSSLESSTPTLGVLANIMDLDPYTVATLPSTIGTFVSWTVENLEGSKWNTFNLVGSSTVTSWGFDINGWLSEGSDPITMFSDGNVTVTSRTKSLISVPVALAGFRTFRWEITDQGSATTSLGAMFTAYCKASGAVCPAEGTYPSVGEGQISSSVCPEGYRGYSYRLCEDGVFGEVQLDHCSQKAPTGVRYRNSHMTFVMDTQVSSGIPVFENIVEHWYIDEGIHLPAGLTLNEKTGEISGVPTVITEMVQYVIYAENQAEAVAVEVTISIRKGRCLSEGFFPLTDVGEVAVHECSTQGNYVGTQTRTCILGTEDGEWQKASGFCMSIATIVILVIVAIVIILVVVLILIRVSKKKHAVGGVKGKKVVKSTIKKTRVVKV
ncbi:hypothetical protein JH06_2968 [Blastocystis sp. subtype 4]|uniref:hypothetical protein n=1 Tax=Blastocystis sp. subtype 4 TaxID=944170 RepID=UPI0007113E79|nr:hypothetical protein JH06_2968 [Blastocystis sp. subtype 4]KNB43289.1 hypothetical protein JH06_2968 [Blastocystis sp. subtype 4]|eukprot:XP_014526732.1 hypothetical protein JH06_2968 [Blastocystis sp. subtype 4]